jgi:protein SCO1/2
MQSPERAANFVLTTDDGTPAGLYDFKDQVVLLYFGYTYCPDVCPATLAELKAAYNALTPRQQEKVQVILISVDPERDTPEKLREYLDFFHEDFMGMTGTEDELLAATTPLGIFFRKHEGSAASGYLVDHTASVAVIDRDGYLRLMYPFNTRGADIASDLRRLVR